MWPKCKPSVKSKKRPLPNYKLWSNSEAEVYQDVRYLMKLGNSRGPAVGRALIMEQLEAKSRQVLWLFPEETKNQVNFGWTGIAVGNGYINKNFNDNSFLYYVYYHGLIDENLWNDLLASCCADRCSSKCMFSENQSVQCMNVISASNAATDGLDVYNIYAPCDGGVQTLLGRRSGHPRRPFRFVPEKQLLFRDNIFLKMNNASRSLGSRSITTCVDDTNQIVYFNTVDVRQALNVDVPEVDNWNTCSEQVAGSYRMTYNALQAQYMKILAYKVPTLLYAGDVDTACNYLGILWFVDDLGLKMHKPLKQWLYLDRDGTRQVGGVQKTLYLNETPLWYVTVRGSGHMVPQDKPIPAYHLITQFIQGISL
ncbi:hypothetical protein CRM22_004157 [Opisthorchis felineus]|uniref:Carboxypeptidase n=1 Tax=Opisthorchis felineus TaxID=147828 RepID=A0A4S2M3Z4_OPIFE|nr:hypothetical protein CRM22_004157 [Opisthorchis felineus]